MKTCMFGCQIAINPEVCGGQQVLVFVVVSAESMRVRLASSDAQPSGAMEMSPVNQGIPSVR